MTDLSIHQWLEKNQHLLNKITKHTLNQVSLMGVQSIYGVNYDLWKAAGGLEPHYRIFTEVRDSFYVMKQSKPYQSISIKQ